MAKAVEVTTQFENEGAKLALEPTSEAGGLPVLSVIVLRGKTDEGKSRVKAVSGEAEAESSNWRNAVIALLKVLGNSVKEYPLDGVEPEWPAVEDDKPQSWSDYDGADELKESGGSAVEGLKLVRAGEGNVKEGTRMLGAGVAKAADVLSKDHFEQWLVDMSPELADYFTRNKNAKSELTFVANLPEAFFSALPASATSAKSMQLRYTTVIRHYADVIAERAYKVANDDERDYPDGAEVQIEIGKALQQGRETIGSAWKGTTVEEMVSCADIHLSSMEGLIGAAVAFNEEEGEYLVARDDDGKPLVTGVAIKGKANSPSEFVTAVVKALNGLRPDVVDQKMEDERSKAAAAKVAPKVFADYTVDEAAAHLGTILGSHGDWNAVLGALNTMADEVDNGETWANVVQQTLNKVAADTAAAEAEAGAEDAA